MKLKFNVTGMTCAACSAHVEKAVGKLDVKSCSVNLLSNSMIVEFDEGKVTEKDIINAVKKAGYGASLNSMQSNVNEVGEGRLKRLIASMVLTVLLLYVAMAHMLKLPLYAFFDENYALQSIYSSALQCL